MKKSAIILVSLLAIALGLPAASAETDLTVLKDQKAKTSYALGLSWGSQLKTLPIAIDPNVLLMGVKDALTGGKTLITDDEAEALLNQLQKDIEATHAIKVEAGKKAGDTNKKAGDAFLSANKAKEGVVVLPSGLQYKVLVSGTGPKPTLADSVVCNYVGTLIDGTVFDSSYKRGKPATFPVGKVISGWTEALQLMPVGSKWRLFVPSNLAYKEQGAGDDIGPNSTLIFDVELLSIQRRG